MSAVPRSPEEAKELLSSLKGRVSDLEARIEAFSTWLDTTDDRVSELEDELNRKDKRIEAIEARLDVVEGGSTGKKGKVRQIVIGAENNRTGEQTAVVMDVERITTATGVSRRYAYDLIDDLPEQYHWILTRQEARQRQFGSVEIDSDGQTKAVVVDFERLHNDPEAVNKFTTAHEGEGG